MTDTANHSLGAIAAARRVAALTGAGISAESGVPTFRDAQTGLWAQFDPLKLATPDAFRRNPKLVWDWYAWRRKLVAQARAQRRSSRAGRTRRTRFRFRADHAKRRRPASARGEPQRRRAARQHRPRQMLARGYDRRALDRGRRRGRVLRRRRQRRQVSDHQQQRADAEKRDHARQSRKRSEVDQKQLADRRARAGPRPVIHSGRSARRVAKNISTTAVAVQASVNAACSSFEASSALSCHGIPPQ